MRSGDFNQPLILPELLVIFLGVSSSGKDTYHVPESFFTLPVKISFDPSGDQPRTRSELFALLRRSRRRWISSKSIFTSGKSGFLSSAESAFFFPSVLASFSSSALAFFVSSAFGSFFSTGLESCFSSFAGDSDAFFPDSSGFAEEVGLPRDFLSASKVFFSRRSRESTSLSSRVK